MNFYLRRVLLMTVLLVYSLCPLFYAQPNLPEWAPIGAQWKFIYNIGVSNSKNKAFLLTSTKDTTIAGVTARVLKGVVHDYDNGHDKIFPDEYIHQSGDSVFYYHRELHEFTLLYHMGAKVGDTIKILEPYFYTGQGDSLIRLEVLDTGSITVMSERLRSLHVQQLEPFSDFEFNGLLIEKIGCISYYFLPTILFFCDEECVSILCNYSDHTISAEFNEDECDIALSNKNQVPNEMRLYPNPTNDITTIISSRNSKYRVRIFSSTQQLIQTLTTNDEIDLTGLPPGLYFIQVRVDSNFFTFKITKI